MNVSFSSDTGATITWNAPPGGAAGYTVLRSTSAAGPFGPVGSTTTGTSFIDSTVRSSTTYFYEVIASGRGDSAPSSPPASVTTPSFGAVGVVADPDVITYGNTIPSSPLAPRPGHSFYISGNTSTGSTISTWADASAITPNTVNDLVLNVTPYDITGYTPIAEGINSPPGSTSPLNSARLMTNGITQNQVGSFPSTGAVPAIGSGTASDPSNGTNVISDVNTTFVMSYNLGAAPSVTPSPTGYDISEIDVITGHQDLRTAMPLLDVLVEPVGSSQFYSLSQGRGFSLIQVPDGAGNFKSIIRGSAQMAIVGLTPGQLLGKNIQAVKFSELTTGNPATFFRELVVTGTPSPSSRPPRPRRPMWSPRSTCPPSSRGILPPMPLAMPFTLYFTRRSLCDRWKRHQSNLLHRPCGTASHDLLLPDRRVGQRGLSPQAPSNSVTTTNFGANAFIFQNQLWQGPISIAEQLPQINFSGQGNSGQGYPLASGFNANAFSVFVEGTVTTDLAGTYLFGANTDDDGYLYLNGQLVSSNTGTHGQRLANVTIPVSLSANTAYDFVFLEDNRSGPWGFQMYWQEPNADGSRAPIAVVPSNHLSSDFTNSPVPQITGITTSTLSDSAVQLNWTTTNDTRSYSYVLQRAFYNPANQTTGTFSTVRQIFSGPLSTGAAGAPRLGATTGIDTTAAPSTSYVYQIGLVMPGAAGPSIFSPPSLPLTTPALPSAVLAADGTLSVTLGAFDAAFIFNSGGNLVFNLSAPNLFSSSTRNNTIFSAPASSVTALNITGPTGFSSQVNLQSLTSLSFSGAVTINHVSDVSINGSNSATPVPFTAGQLQILNANNITIASNCPITSAGLVDLEADTNININANLTSHGPITLLADNNGDFNGTLLINTGVTVNSNGGAINTHFFTLTINGTVNAGAGDVTYAGNANSFNAAGYTSTISSGTITLTSGASTSPAPTPGAGATGTIFYNFQLAPLPSTPPESTPLPETPIFKSSSPSSSTSPAPSTPEPARLPSAPPMSRSVERPPPPLLSSTSPATSTSPQTRTSRLTGP